MISEGLSGPSGEVLRAGQTVEVELQVMEEPPPFGPAQHLPAGSGKKLPGPDGRVNLSLFHHPPVRAPFKVNSSTY